jgi:hypothetical protein
LALGRRAVRGASWRMCCGRWWFTVVESALGDASSEVRVPCWARDLLAESSLVPRVLCFHPVLEDGHEAHARVRRRNVP